MTTSGQNAPKITGDILLEAGTNELEVLMFTMCGGWFGVNVAKVREVIRPVKTISTPHQHPSVIGMFNIRGRIVPVVDLARHLGMQRREEFKAEPRIIITEFNGMRCGFQVDTVEQIHRMSWQKVRPAPKLDELGNNTAGHISSTTGLIELKDKLVLMVDFESVSDSILVQETLHVSDVANDLNVDRGSKRVIIAEDSPFMRSVITRVFKASGYTKLEVYADGEQAWQAIQKPGPKIDAIVSDIEMPRMDGLHLTKRIKEHVELKAVPVILFSSLVSEDNRKKGQQVGADVQIPKPELPEMVRLVDKVCCGQRVGIAQQAA